MLRATAAVLVLLAGCDVAFGLERHGDTVDAASDGNGTGAIRSLSIVGPVMAGKTATIHAELTRDAGETVSWTLLTSAGSLAQPSGTVQLDGSGNGTLDVQWTAPTTTQNVMIRLDALGDSASIFVPVDARMTFGDDEDGTTSLVLGTNGVYAVKALISATGSVSHLGIWIGSTGGGHARLGLYADAAGPSMKLAETASSVPALGRNLIPVTVEALVPPGTYWIAVHVDGPTTARVSNGSFVYAAVLYGAGLPATFPTAQTTPGSQPQLFGVITQ